MRIRLLLIALGLLLAGNVSADEGRVAPDWTLQSASGESVTLSDVTAEQPVILLFWATWCPYCKALMPHIQSIQLEYGDAVRVLAVHFRDDKGDPVAYIRNAGYDFTLLPDGNEVAKLNGVWATPGLLIIDRDRNVRFNLYTLPPPASAKIDESMSNSRKAAHLAPHWAAELRKSLDVVLKD